VVVLLELVLVVVRVLVLLLLPLLNLQGGGTTANTTARVEVH
jgi:hypothetical protein